MLTLPGEATTEELLALNQQRPLLSVEKRQPADHHLLLLQRAQHSSILLPGAEPRPGVCGLMSVSLSGARHRSLGDSGTPLGPLNPDDAVSRRANAQYIANGPG